MIAALFGHLEMGLYVTGFRALSLVRPIADLVRTAARLAGRYEERAGGEVGEAVEAATRAAGRSSKLVPGASCLHRALASRVWLARRGIASEIVVGFRKEGHLEGHAWLEVFGPEGPTAIFEESGYRESFREPAAIERASDTPLFP